MKMQQEDRHLQVKKGAFLAPSPVGTLILDFKSELKHFCCLVHSICGILLWQSPMVWIFVYSPNLYVETQSSRWWYWEVRPWGRDEGMRRALVNEVGAVIKENPASSQASSWCQATRGKGHLWASKEALIRCPEGQRLGHGLLSL